MKKLISILFLLPFIALAQQDTIISGAYNWKQPEAKKNKIASVVLLEGRAHDFEWMQLSANNIYGTRPIKQNVPRNREEVIIIKTGAVRIHFEDSSFLLTPNSIAVLMPGEKYSLENAMNEHSDFYTMKYLRKDTGVIQDKGVNHSFVKRFEDARFKPNTIGGGRRDFFETGTVMQKRFEIHVSSLKEGVRSHDPHTHKAEEIVLLIDGDTEMQIGDQFKKVDKGGFYYLGSNVLHAIKNIGTAPSTYFAIQFE
jgi:(S)-ureidoglycine aminohydrolase